MSTLILPFLIFLTIPPNFLLPLLPTVFFCLTLCFMCMSESDESDWQRLCLIKFSLNPKLSLPLPLSFYLKGQRVTEREECVSAVMGMKTLEPSPSIYLLNTVLHTHTLAHNARRVGGTWRLQWRVKFYCAGSCHQSHQGGAGMRGWWEEGRRRQRRGGEESKDEWLGDLAV